LKEVCEMAKNNILLAGPNQAYLFGQLDKEQSDKMFMEIIGNKIIKDEIDVFILIMNYEIDFINEINARSSGTINYYDEMNRVKNYLEMFDERLKDMYGKNDIKKIEKHLSICSLDYWLYSICLIDKNQGYFQLVDRKTVGGDRIIFYLNQSDKRFLDYIQKKYIYFINDSKIIWRKSKNESVFGSIKK